MFSNPMKLILFAALLVICQPQVSYTQSVSIARSKAAERQVELGRLGISRGVVNAETVTNTGGGFANGGITTVGKSQARSSELNLGRLGIGSTLTRSKTITNGAVSKALSHDLNIGRLGVETSLSRDNLRNGLGLQRSQDGGVQLGLGFLNIDLSRNQKQQTGALTHAQAQAQGIGAQAKSDSNSQSKSKQIGRLAINRSNSESNAISKTQFGQTSASAGGLAGGAAANVNSFGLNRVRRNPTDVRNPVNLVPRRTVGRPKRKVQFIPFAYPGNDLNRPKRQFGRPLFGGRLQRPGFGFQQQPYFGFGAYQKQNANAQGLANNQFNGFQQQAGANTLTNQGFNSNGLFQNNGASSIGSNLATDGSSGQLSSANVDQQNSFNNDGSQSTNTAQSQALNFDKNQQQAVNSNAGTKEIVTANGGRLEANGGSQSTNTNQFGTSTNIANTNSAIFQDGNTSGSQADSSSQSIFQGNNGGNSAAQTNSNVNTIQGPNGFVSNTATSNASAVSGSGQSANAVSSANANQNGGSTVTNSNAGFFGGLGAQSNSGAFGNFGGSQGFANGGFRAFKIRKRKSTASPYLPQRCQQKNQTSLPTLEIINDSTEINWPKNRIQHYNHFPQHHQQQPQPQQHEQQHKPTEKHLQQPPYYSSINPNSSTEQFAVIDENERHGRTFTFITDLINNFSQPTCIYPCTMDAYQKRRCCENVVVLPPPNVCCQQPQVPPPVLNPSMPPVVQPPVLVSPVQPLPAPTFPLIPTQCCTTCPAYGYYGPPPCIRYTMPGGGPGRVPLYMG